MSNFMFVVPPLYGHITATLSVGGELIKRGHNVCWVSLKEIEAGFIPQGGLWIVPENIKNRKAEIDAILQRLNLGTGLSGDKALDFYFEEAQTPFASILTEEMQSVVDSFKPDVIIHDESAFAGAIVAVKNNIPYVTSITVPPGFFEPALLSSEKQNERLEKIKKLQKKLGVDSESIIFNSSLLTISFSALELLTSPHKSVAVSVPITYVGPSVEGRIEPSSFDWAQVKQKDWPKIYVSIGTLLDDIRSVIFKRIIDAFCQQPLTIIVNTDPELFEQWPDNFIVQRVCPQLEILSKVDLVVTHAGFNTVNEALFFDLPMIALPLAWDQDFNADLIEFHECGKKLRYRRLHATSLIDSVNEILTTSKYRENAARLGQILRDNGGTKRAADLIEKLMT